MIELFANSGEADQVRGSAASALGLHCLPITHLGVSRLQWAKDTFSNDMLKLKLNKKQQKKKKEEKCHIYLGPVVQSVVSLTSSLRVISLTVLADSIYNILIFFAEKMWVAFALQKLLTFFQQKISAYLHITRCKF